MPLNDENPSQNFHFKKKYFGSEAIYLLEKLYVSMVEGNNSNRYIFKTNQIKRCDINSHLFYLNFSNKKRTYRPF